MSNGAGVDEELETLRSEHRMLQKKLAERRLLMERVWEEKQEEDERIQQEERQAAEADSIGYERTLIAQAEIADMLNTLAIEDAARKPFREAPKLLALEPHAHQTKIAKLRAREAAKGITY